MQIDKRNGYFDISTKKIRKALMQTIREMQEELVNIIDDNSLNSKEKNIKIAVTIEVYKQIYCFLKSILKLLIKSVKKSNITGLFLSSQISEKFKIYNLN